MVQRHSDTTIDVRRDVVMFHTVLCVDDARQPVAVAITTNPMQHGFYAQVVMHKTRSHGCAVQVARYVRRRFGIETPVATHRAARPVECMIGYAVTTTAQHAPNERTPGWGAFQHIAATPISRLLEEVADGHNASRTRYVVYEVRGHVAGRMRAVTHNYPAVERRFLEAPPDTVATPDLAHVGRYATRQEADRQLETYAPAGDHMWTRKPPIAYLRRLLKLTPDDVLWTCDGTSAVRRHYATPSVCIGPHVYTEYQVRAALEHGAWPPNGNSAEGRRLMYGPTA